jgi:hypothetical protein
MQQTGYKDVGERCAILVNITFNAASQFGTRLLSLGRRVSKVKSNNSGI